jgi:3-deoxy-D-manno-octulosonate 8-phosphate phosphatase (KDO 8-P phosphatase)
MTDTLHMLEGHYAALRPGLLERARDIRLLTLDVDGVMTDGSLYFTATGESLKSFNIKDGLGIKQALAAGITVAVITGRDSPMVAQRCAALGIEHIYQGREDKLAALDQLLAVTRIELRQLAHVGDDLPDLPVMRRARLGIAVADAHPFVAHHAHWLTACRGGRGAVREVTDLLLFAQGKLAPALDASLQ